MYMTRRLSLQQDLADRRVAHALDSVTGNYSSKERQPAPVSELSHNLPYQSCEQGDVENLTKQVNASSRNDHN